MSNVNYSYQRSYGSASASLGAVNLFQTAQALDESACVKAGKEAQLNTPETFCRSIQGALTALLDAHPAPTEADIAKFRADLSTGVNLATITAIVRDAQKSRESLSVQQKTGGGLLLGVLGAAVLGWFLLGRK